MALILNIDTSTATAAICLSKDGTALSFMQNEDQQDHASWLHTGIEKIMHEAGYGMVDLQAVAVSSGPGSYTGLRVSLAAAKGFCYSLQIPLIMENSLRVMAFAAGEQAIKAAASLICPMIDARRMEVYTALYGTDLQEMMAPSALVLDPHSFGDFLRNNRIFFTGDGIKKWQALAGSTPNALFGETNLLANYLGIISGRKYDSGEFADMMYSEPVYLKEFYTHEKK